MTFLGIVITLYLLDLSMIRKIGTRFSGSCSSSTSCARLSRAAESGFHRLSRPDGVVVFVDLDIAPAHHRAMRDVALQLDAMGYPDRQGASGEAFGSRHQLAPHRV